MALASLVVHIHGGTHSLVVQVHNPVPTLGNRVLRPVGEVLVVRHPSVPVYTRSVVDQSGVTGIWRVPRPGDRGESYCRQCRQNARLLP